MSTVYMFPGQGSQFPGMGKELYAQSAQARAMFQTADSILGFPITSVMFEGTAEDLKATKVTQPAVFLHSVVAAACASAIPAPDMVGGHSLGEFSALVAAGAVGYEDALRLVAVRAEAMSKCCAAVPGTMAAVIGLAEAQIEKICSETPGVVVAANYNCDGQVVISGESAAVAAACEKLKEAGARRALPLAVSGAFHSPLMEAARAELASAIENTKVSAPRCPIYQNVSALPETDPSVIKSNLLQQLTSPVKWSQSVQNMLAAGANHFIEFGPGAVLQGLVKRIAGSAEDIQIEGIQ